MQNTSIDLDSTAMLVAIVAISTLLLAILAVWWMRRQRRRQGQRKQVFMCYQTDTNPDQAIAAEIAKGLSAQHQVFFERTLKYGLAYVAAIKTEIAQSDWFVILVSARSSKSSIILDMLSDAQQAQLICGKPQIIQVLLRDSDPIKVSVANQQGTLALRYTHWTGAEETQRVIEEIEATLAGFDVLPKEPSQLRPETAQPATATLLRPQEMLAQDQMLTNIMIEPVAPTLGLTIQASHPQHPVVPPVVPPLMPPPQPVVPSMPPAAVAYNPSMVTARDLLREPPEGAMPPDSPLYVERDFDEIAVQRIRQSDVTLMIKGPRQVGKSSLLQRLMKSAQDVQKRVVFLDFQRFDDSAMSTADDFFRQFFVLLTDLLGQPLDQVQHYWSLPLGNRMRGTRYMEQLLRTSPSSIVLAMDEVDRLLHIPFRTDFFGMIRSWHNERANVGSIWRRLDLVMIISTDPHLLIPNATESPFNVAESIRVLDFSQKEVEQLNFLYRSPFSQSQVEDLYTLLNGHPYLVRRALYSVICRFTDVPALFEQAGTDHGVFTDHLQTYLYRLYGNQRLINSLLEVIQHHSCTDQEMFFRLRGAGLIREENQQVLPRCRLYAEYFKRHLLPE